MEQRFLRRYPPHLLHTRQGHTDSNLAEYGESEYNVSTSEYNASILINNPKVNTTGNGSVVQIGMEADVNNAPFSIQKFLEIPWDIYDRISFFKLGFVITGATFGVYLLNVYALKTLKASTVGMFIYLQPIIGIIYAIASGNDILKLTDIIAISLIFSGIYLVSLKKEAN